MILNAILSSLCGTSRGPALASLCYSNGGRLPAGCICTPAAPLALMSKRLIVLIAQFWPSQIWFRQLTNLLIDFTRRLPDRSNLLRNPETHELYPEPARLRLTAWKLSADQSLRKTFRHRWPTLPPRDAVSQPEGFIMTVSGSASSGSIFCPCDRDSGLPLGSGQIYPQG